MPPTHPPHLFGKAQKSIRLYLLFQCVTEILTHMRYRPLPHMPGGEYILRRDYSTIPSPLILCRVLARCHHVRDEFDNIRRQALAERWHPLIQGLAECSVSKNVVCSLDLAGLTGRRHQSVTRAIERRMKQRSYFLPAKSRYVAPTGLRSGMYIMKPGRRLSRSGLHERGHRRVRLLRIAGRACELRRALVQARPVDTRQAMASV